MTVSSTSILTQASGHRIHLINFPPCLTREITFVTSCLRSCTSNPFWKGVYSERKEFAPMGSKFFHFRVNPFSEGRQKQYWQSCLPWNCIDSPWRLFDQCQIGRCWLNIHIFALSIRAEEDWLQMAFSKDPLICLKIGLFSDRRNRIKDDHGCDAAESVSVDNK